MGGGGGASGGGVSGILGSLGGIFSGGSKLGPGGTAPFLSSVTGGTGSAGTAGGLAGIKSMLGLGGSLANLKNFAGIIPKGTLSQMSAMSGQSALSLQLSSIGHSAAAAAAGIGLFTAGVQKGGTSGLAMTTAGGALTGFKYGGPLGAAIGGAVGFITGLFGLGRETPEEKMRKKIKSAYSVDIKDTGVLRQMISLAQQSYVGSYDRAIRSSQGQSMIEQYAQMTGQTAKNIRPTMSSATLMESGGILSQQASYSNGVQLPYSGGLPGSSLNGVSLSGSSNAGPIVVKVQLSAPETKAFLEKGYVETLSKSSKIIQAASVQATKASSNRRELTALQLAPGTITS